MKKLALAAVLLAAMAGCGATGGAPASNDVDAQPTAVPSGPPTEAARAVAPSTLAFGLDLYRRLGDGNLFFSPASLSTALGMVQAGARGETQAEIGRALHYPADQADLHRGLGDLQRALPLDAEGRRLTIANALWAQRGFALRPDYVAAVRTDYGAAPVELDFRDSAAAAGRINGWAERNTNGRIRNIVDPATLGPDSRLILTNTIWFLADWDQQFRREATRERDFFVSGGAPVRALLMHQTGDFRYLEQPDFQALELPYEGGEMAMVVLLPRARLGLAAFERGMTAERLSEWLGILGRAQLRRVEVALPKLRLGTRYDLPGPLQAMGMRLAFTDRADFSGMAGEPLRVSRVIHQTFLNVDEEGTEAAAATMVDMAATGPAPARPVQFHADRPFFFLIRDTRTGAVLFMGRIERPEQQN